MPVDHIIAARDCPTCGLPDTLSRDFCPRCGEYLRWEDDQGRPAPAPEPRTERAVEFAPALAPDPVVLLLGEEEGDVPHVRVEPGGCAVLTGLIRNQTGLVDHYDLRVS